MPQLSIQQAFDLAVQHHQCGRVQEAEQLYGQILAQQPGNADALHYLGVLAGQMGRHDIAVDLIRRAIALIPDYHQAHNNLGNILKEMGQLDQAIAAWRQAMVLKASYPEAHSNLIFSLHCYAGADAGAIAQECRRWNQQYAEPLKPLIRPHGNERNPNRRLRIGYVSPDFRRHVVGQFLLPLLANHDHQCVEVFAYSQVAAGDDLTERLRAHTDGWRNLVGLSNAQAVALIRQDQIDILVDLALHTAGNRLLVFAQKPAPVQVTYLAYAGSSGLTTMDYRLSDPYLDAPGMDESFYSEQTFRLPETYWCYQSPVDLPLAPLPALAKGFITFGCLNNFCKVNEPLLKVWAKLLRGVPGSRLLLHAGQGSHRQRVLDCLQKEGINSARVSFAGKVSVAVYFQQYQEIDIALDTHPFGGGTTTCDALWMGVPVISLAGKMAVGRHGLSILSNVGLPELVASTPEEYVRIGVALASDLLRLQHLRSTLRQRMTASPLMDARRFAGNIEAVYRQMWKKWCGA